MAERRPPPPFPTANDIAQAVVIAARLFDENPIAVVGEAARSRARILALEALAEAFPGARKTRLAELVGFAKPAAHGVVLRHARSATWWNEAHVDEIVGELVKDEYGEWAL